MTIRTRLTLRFTGLVSTFLALTFACIYGFSWYFISSDFYRRLDNKAITYADILARYRLTPEQFEQHTRLRRDQLPNQKITVYNSRNEPILTTNPSIIIGMPASELDVIRRRQKRHFQWRQYYVSGLYQTGGNTKYVVLVSAENLYGDDFLRTMLWAFAGLFGLIVGIVAFAGWLYAGDALEPMQRIEQQLSAIFPNNRQARLPINRENDEISRLSRTINRLLDRVEESFQLQKMFVANVSHELRNPLTQISSQLEVSLLQERNPEAYQQTIRSVLEDVSELATLTHELLKLSQVSNADADTLLKDTVRVDEIVWTVLDEVKSTYSNCSVLVDVGELPVDFEQLTVPGNSSLIKTVFKNLIENACKFSTDTKVQVQVRFAAESILISVKNNGPAIPSEDLPYIFEPFFRSQQTAEKPGSGVGLSLIDRIVRLHGGHLNVHSEEGQPIIFVVELFYNPVL